MNLPITLDTSVDEMKLKCLPAKENAFFSIVLQRSFKVSESFCIISFCTLIPFNSILAKHFNVSVSTPEKTYLQLYKKNCLIFLP